ncbi:hypothetical protein MC378_07980 [Polaribacter sp. MSW13]|uniref:Uncharacterized protein n=1 Tax=Polaribacter marinus TaxID=2916838 RepID=A0A9X1VQ82_9FLAO|nr:hypothetical protein [Polaribacter marinus]MCI2229102.1 hypothetical protein [Polaribacter marinus]
MKHLLTFSCFLLIISCNAKKPKTQAPSFLLGNWIRLNDKDSVTTYETWKKDFSGTGITLKGKDTTFFEQMKILTKNDTLFLEVTGVNESPTLFQFTQQTDTSFICINPQNEFPKKIKYYLEGKLLKAEISSDDFIIDFIFKQLK